MPRIVGLQHRTTLLSCFHIGGTPAKTLLRIQRRPRPLQKANAVESETKGKTNPGDDDSAFEKQLKSRRNKQKKLSVQDLQPDSIPSPSKLDSMPAEDRLESSAILLLISLFVAIIGQGLFLAVSGFLPESWDQFAQNVVYKTFSPTVGIFLAFSAGYGVWKSKQGTGGK